MKQQRMKYWATVCIMLACCATFAADDKSKANIQKKVEKADGYQFGQNLSVSTSKYQSSEADFQCEKLYEDFSMVSGVAKLAQVKLTSAINGQDYKNEMIALSRKQVWIPVTVETMIGDKLHDSLIEQRQIVTEPESELNKRDLAALRKADEILAQIVNNLPADQPYTFKLYVNRTDGVNASAYPGGRIYVTRQALRLGANELALMLAHEVSHITKRHLIKEIQVKVVDSATAFSDVQVLMSGDPNLVGKGIGTLLGVGKLFEQFPINQEHEADACGVKLISNQPNINAANAIKGFLKISQNRKSTSGPIGSHPSYENRQKLMTMASQRFSAEQFVGSGADKKIANATPLEAGAASLVKEENKPEETGLQGFFGKLSNVLKSGSSEQNQSNKDPKPASP